MPVAAPNAFGNSRYGDPSGISYWGEQNTNEDAAGFAGTVILLAAATGLGFRRRFPQERLAWLVVSEDPLAQTRETTDPGSRCQVRREVC